MKRMGKSIATMLLIFSMFIFPSISQASRLVVVDQDVVKDTYTGVYWYRHMEHLTSKTYSEQKAFINDLPPREGYSPWRMAKGEDIWGNFDMGDGLVDAVQDSWTEWSGIASFFYKTGEDVEVPYEGSEPLIIECILNPSSGHSGVRSCLFDHVQQIKLWRGRVNFEMDSFKEVHSWIWGQIYATCHFSFDETVACGSPSLEHYGYVLADNARDSTVGAWICATPANRPPVFVPVEDQSVTEGETVEFSVYASDPDFRNALTYSASNLPTGATFEPASRTFSWTPSYQHSGTYYQNILFTVTDNGTPNLGDSMTVRIMVGQGNRAPKFALIGDKDATVGQLLKFSVTATDPDPWDSLSFEAGNLPDGASFVSDSQEGVFTWVPTAGQDATHFRDILFRVTDDGTPPKNDWQFISICVGNCNGAPRLRPIGNKAVLEGETLEFIVIGTDADGNVTLAYSAENLPPGASFDPATQMFSWTPDYNQSGTYQDIVFTVADSGSPPLSASENISITVGDANRPPVLNPIGNKTGSEGKLLEIVVSGEDPDNNVLSYTVAGLPQGAAFNASTQKFSWTPSYTQAGEYTVTFRVTDSGNLSDSEVVKITIKNYDTTVQVTAIGQLSGLLQVDQNAATTVTSAPSVVNPGQTETHTVQVNPGDCTRIISLLGFPGSEFRLEVYDPDGQLFGVFQSTSPPIFADIPHPAVGLWRFKVVTLEVPHNYYSVAFVTGVVHNKPPIAGLNAPSSGSVGSAITFDASASQDLDGSIAAYSWDWNNDGVYEETTALPVAAHTFGAPYNGMVGLKVIDDVGASGNAAVSIVITPLPGDLNGDGKADCADLAIVKASFGKKRGQAGYNPVADVNNDGVVNVRDLATVSRQVPTGTVCN